MRQILPAGEEPQERATLLAHVLADRAAQHRVTSLQRVEDRLLGDLRRNVELHLARHARQRPEMGRQRDANHGRVCTSTDSTAGKSRTMGAQPPPASVDAHTRPPGVPKYPPPPSRAPTAHPAPHPPT